MIGTGACGVHRASCPDRLLDARRYVRMQAEGFSGQIALLDGLAVLAIAAPLRLIRPWTRGN